MNLKHWCELDELIYISETDEEYKQYAGLNYNEKLIEQLAELKITNSKIFTNFYSHPRPLLIGAIEDIAYSKTKKLELELHNERKHKDRFLEACIRRFSSQLEYLATIQ